MLAFHVDASLTFTNPSIVVASKPVDEGSLETPHPGESPRRGPGQRFFSRADGARPDPHGARGPGAPQKAQIHRRGARRAPREKEEIGLREAGPPRARGATTMITKL